MGRGLPLCGLGGRPRYRRDGMTPARQKAFIEALGQYGTVSDAARVAGISSTSAYRARKRMPDFARAWAAAKSKAAGAIDTLAWERGVTGVAEPVYHYGKFSHVRVKRSDAIFRMIMMAADPDKYGRLGGGGLRPEALDKLKEAIRAELRPEIEAEFRENPPRMSRAKAMELRKAIEAKLDALEAKLRARGVVPAWAAPPAPGGPEEAGGDRR